MPDSSTDGVRSLLSVAKDDGTASELAALGLKNERDMLEGRGEAVDFTFDYRGFLFAVRAEVEDGGSAARIKVHANLGSLPYTAESGNNRLNAITVIRSAVKSRGGRFRFTRNQRIMLMENIRIDGKLTPEKLVGSLAKLLLEARPYLALLELVVNPPVRPSAAETNAALPAPDSHAAA
ncbi:MAG: hypothetical protein ACPGOV_12785 [Magnetovibrionaceae bacterium]